MLARTYPVSGPLDLRRTLAPLRAGRATRRSGLAPRTRLAGDADARWPGDARRSPTSATSSAPRPGARAADGRWRSCRRLLGSPRAGGCPAGHPLIDGSRPSRPGCPDPADSGAVLESLVPAILEQKVTGQAARRASSVWSASTASRPRARRMAAAARPAPAALAALPYYAYHPFGVEQRRADLIRRVPPGRPGSRRSSTCRSPRPTPG